MKCNQQEKIEILHKGELQGEAQDSVLAHLKNCEDCQSYLLELKEQEEVVLSKVKDFRPVLTNPDDFRNEVLEMIGPKNIPAFADRYQLIRQAVSQLLDAAVAILVQPVVRYSFISSAVVIFGVFLYQQTIIVQKIGTIEQRMENSQNERILERTGKKAADAILKRRPQVGEQDRDYYELLEDYRVLMFRHKVLIKALQEKYPETYRDILKDLDEAGVLSGNMNI